MCINHIAVVSPPRILTLCSIVVDDWHLSSAVKQTPSLSCKNCYHGVRLIINFEIETKWNNLIKLFWHLDWMRWEFFTHLKRFGLNWIFIRSFDHDNWLYFVRIIQFGNFLTPFFNSIPSSHLFRFDSHELDSPFASELCWWVYTRRISVTWISWIG